MRLSSSFRKVLTEGGWEYKKGYNHHNSICHSNWSDNRSYYPNFGSRQNHRQRCIPEGKADWNFNSRHSTIKKGEEKSMKKVVITIIMFAIAIGLVVGVIIPIANHGKTAGQSANTRFTAIDGNVTTLADPIN
jgi:hypothetical protein